MMLDSLGVKIKNKEIKLQNNKIKFKYLKMKQSN